MQGSDAIDVTGVLGKDTGALRTATVLNTNAGDDDVNVILTPNDALFVLNTEEGDDKINASLSTADLILIGGLGNDTIYGGMGRNVIFGDQGMKNIYY